VADAMGGTAGGTQAQVGGGLDADVCSRWRLTPGRVLGDRAIGTWEATRDGEAFVVKRFRSSVFTDWRYPLRVAAALRAQGWPTPQPVEEPLTRPDGAWVLFRRLPGRPVTPADKDKPAEQRARGRLLAEFHAAAAATGITDQRGGFTGPAELLADPQLDHWLRVHELANRDEGRMLRACRDTAMGWFADNPTEDAARSVIHGDFTPWNLLFDNGRLTGVLDFEATHYTFQVADFALSWRGYQDNVLRGYDEVRALSDLEWHLVRPAFWAWLFIGVKDLLAAHYGDTQPVNTPLNLGWQIVHLHKHSALLAHKAGTPRLSLGR
jgi:aminoglycoside phosphotransferase (APT) family kinase protein